MTGPVFTILLLLSVAADAEEQFVKGNDLYLSGAFEAALECYREGLSGKCNAGRFHYNSGNCLFRIGRYGEARYHYLAALEYLPRDDRVRHNIGVVSQRLDLEFQAFPGQRRFATAEEVSTAALLLLSPAFLSFALLCLTRRAWLARLGTALFLAGMVAAGASIVLQGVRLFSPDAGVAVTPAEVRSEPSDQVGELLFSLSEGESASIVDERGGWIRIEDEKDRRGWVRSGPVWPLP